MDPEISAPAPYVRLSSYTTIAFPVFRTDSKIVSLSSGAMVRTSTTSAENPSSSCRRCAASREWWSISPYAITVRSSPSRFTSALPMGTV